MSDLIRKCLVIGASAAALSGCVTGLSPDGRIGESQADLEEADARGARQPELSTAAEYLEDASAASEAGLPETYDLSLSLADAYIDLAEARGALDQIEAERADVLASLDTCKSDLEATQAALAETELALLALRLGASNIRKDDDGATLILQTVNFDTGFASLTAETKTRLRALSTYLLEKPEVTARIEGHTDHVGESRANRTLSDARSGSVVNWLVDQGIESKRLSSAGFGESQPIASNETADGRAQNRRVEITLTDARGQ